MRIRKPTIVPVPEYWRMIHSRYKCIIGHKCLYFPSPVPVFDNIYAKHDFRNYLPLCLNHQHPWNHDIDPKEFVKTHSPVIYETLTYITKNKILDPDYSYKLALHYYNIANNFHEIINPYYDKPYWKPISIYAKHQSLRPVRQPHNL